MISLSSQNSFDPISFFYAEINALTLDIRVSAAQNVVILATAIGPEETKERLIPLILAILIDSPEEVLVAFGRRMADVVRVAIPSVEIDIAVLSNFITFLTEMSSFTSPHIHTAILHSVSTFLGYYRGDLAPIAQTIITTLGVSQLSSQREFATMAIPVLYFHISNSFSDIPEAESYLQTLAVTFLSLVQDPDSTIRRIAAESLRQFIEVTLRDSSYDKHMKSHLYLFGCYDKLAADAVDIVRSTNVTNGVLLLRLVVLMKEQSVSLPGNVQPKITREVKEILPLLIKSISRGTSDRYWLVRKYTAETMPVFFEQIHKKLDTSDCAVMFKLLTDDVEPDIRCLSVGNAPQIVAYLDATTMQQIFLPALLQRSEDVDVPVRCALADHCIHELGMAIIRCPLPKDTYIFMFSMIGQIASKLVVDTSFEVRSHIVDTMFDVYLDENTFPSLLELSASYVNDFLTRPDDQWRVRERVLANLQRAVSQSNQRVTELVEERLVSWIVDAVYDIRLHTLNLLPLLASVYGNEWYLRSILPSLQSLLRSSGTTFHNRRTITKGLVMSIQPFLADPSADLSSLFRSLETVATGKSHVQVVIPTILNSIFAYALANGITPLPSIVSGIENIYKHIIDDCDSATSELVLDSLNKLEALSSR